MKRVLSIAMPVLIVGTITAACQTVQTTQGGAVGVQRSQLMMVSAQEIEQASSQQYQSLCFYYESATQYQSSYSDT